MKNMVLIFSVIVFSQHLHADSLKDAKEAIRHRNLDRLNQLLDSNEVAPDAIVKEDETLLNFALSQNYNGGQDPDDVDSIVKTLLAHSADPNKLHLNRDRFGWLVHETHKTFGTPLYTAWSLDRPGAMSLLIADSRTNVNAVICEKHKNGNRPIGTILDFAAGSVVTSELEGRGARHMKDLDPSEVSCQ
jgi:hypothetical protein